MTLLAKNKPKVLVLVPNVDISYVKGMSTILSKHFGGVSLSSVTPERRSSIAMAAKKAQATLVITTSFAAFKLAYPLAEGNMKDNFGTVVEFPGIGGDKIRLIFVPSFLTIYTQNYGAFLLDTYCSKLSKGGICRKDPFSWRFVTPSTINQDVLEINSKAFLMAVDIETSKEDLKITSCSYTWAYDCDGIVKTKTLVVKCSPEEYPFCIDAIRMLNNTKVAKVMQNGKYDAAYFVRFNAPIRNWLYDTHNMMHCMFPELPKDLSFISSFFLEDFTFWKDESGRNLYEYNAKDTHNTIWTFMAQLQYIEKHHCEYAYKNYLMEFPIVFPGLSCGLDGFFVDEERRLTLRAKEVKKYEEALARIQFLLDEPDFNPGSPKQVAQLMLRMKYTKAKNTSEKELIKFADASPLNKLLVDLILEYRGAVKAVSTYFDMSLLNQRLLYSCDPAGTETGRMASTGSAFWCGTQIQNIPLYARAMIRADEGWELIAVDKAQSESYCTGYISQDTNLIHTVTTSPDFHCANASMFFGVKFEALYDVNEPDPENRVLNKPLRKLAKPVNHGANYNMGPDVLVDTMGVKEVIKARKLLNLPMTYSPKDVATYLLAKFDQTYPRIRGDWYKEIIEEVVKTGKLYIPAVGWTRRTFLKPLKSKPDLNAAVAHKPQSLSVHLVNKAFFRIWRELQLGKYRGKFRLKAQVHDEIVSQVRPEIRDQAAEEVAQIMVIPTEVNGRIMTIPSTIAKGVYWNEAK